MKTRLGYKHLKVIVLLLGCAVYLSIRPVPFLPKADAGDKLYCVARVIDGDTLKLSTGEKVRLIGVDTPESYYSRKLIKDAKKNRRDIKTIQALGKKASAFTKALCDGKKVRLEFDVERRDRYKRLLAYVYLEDGTFVNAKIVEEGYAQVMTVTPNVKYADYFLKLQHKARQERKGLWGPEEDL